MSQLREKVRQIDRNRWLDRQRKRFLLRPFLGLKKLENIINLEQNKEYIRANEREKKKIKRLKNQANKLKKEKREKERGERKRERGGERKKQKQ